MKLTRMLRLLTLTRRCKWKGRNLSDFTVRRVCHRGSLSDSKWVDQDQRARVIGSSFSTGRTIPTHPSEKLKVSLPISGVFVSNPVRGAGTRNQGKIWMGGSLRGGEIEGEGRG